MNDLHLRALTLQDFEDAVKLYEVLGTRPGVIKGREGKDRFAQIISLAGTTIFGAELKGKIVSMATSHILPNMTYGGRPYCFVENVVTAKNLQGKGIGRATMEHLITDAWERNAYKIMLLTGRKMNAQGFYEKLGFDGTEKYAMTLRRTPQRAPNS